MGAWLVFRAADSYVEYLRETKVVTGLLCGLLEGVPALFAVLATYLLAQKLWCLMDQIGSGPSRRSAH
ncbi:MAG: hypothetical protein AAGF12_22225 [Myxococcota bacterium]